MLKAELRADTLKALVNIISTLVDEVKFTVTPEGMSLKAVDPAHVAMIELNVGKDAFASYEADETELGVDLDKVKDVLKLASSGDTIAMEQDPERGRLVFKVGNITRRMNLLDTATMSVPKVPQLQLAAAVELPASELQRGIKASESISDHITLVADADLFELKCEGDTDSADLAMSPSDTVSIEAPSRVASTFPLDYFSNLMKAIPAETTVRLELDVDYPVKVVFGIADGRGTVRYLLAPRIEND